ncbi:hypothetical protein Hypma_012907 [Hypsizygus marmoreus]|uniref:Uncharacterized protein n=1 Tax=Hypsizygus marmoreus TaxID=39966 RepID=A0A369JHD4_HYPMA|nr:hypothetical protein Hypma_012907 [Hypsizygus marmoreus]
MAQKRSKIGSPPSSEKRKKLIRRPSRSKPDAQKFALGAATPPSVRASWRDALQRPSLILITQVSDQTSMDRNTAKYFERGEGIDLDE